MTEYENNKRLYGRRTAQRWYIGEAIFGGSAWPWIIGLAIGLFVHYC